MEIGDKIKMHREAMQMTQDDLAKRLGYTSRSSIAKIEAGLSDLPVSKVVAFANVFGITPNELLPKTTIIIPKAPKPELSNKEQKILDKIRMLDDTCFDMLEQYVNLLLQASKKEEWYERTHKRI